MLAGKKVTDADILRYEGLVFKTSSLMVRKVEFEFEDLQQIMRLKVWRALESYDPERSKMTEERYVFACIMNLKKDLFRKKRHNELFIEDLSAAPERESMGSTKFEARYLSVDHEQTFAEVEEEELLIPSTLDAVERRVLCLLYSNYSQREIQRELGLNTREYKDSIESVQGKMADWRPTPAPGEPEGQAQDDSGSLAAT